MKAEPQWKTRWCVACRKRLPRRAFADGWAKKCIDCRVCVAPDCTNEALPKRRTCSQECRAAVHRVTMKRALRIRWERYKPPKRKVCNACGESKPRSREHFYAGRQTDGVVRFDSVCKPCRRAESRERYASDPERRERARIRNARYRDKLKERIAKDPALAAEVNRRKLSYKRRGIEKPDGRWVDVVPAKAPVPKHGVGRLPRLPAAPLGQLLERIVMREQAGRMHGEDDKTRVAKAREEICEEFGTTARSLYAWSHGERQMVSFSTADRVLTATGLNWWDVWPEEKYPKVHEKLEKLAP